MGTPTWILAPLNVYHYGYIRVKPHVDALSLEHGFCFFQFVMALPN